MRFTVDEQALLASVPDLIALVVEDSASTGTIGRFKQGGVVGRLKRQEKSSVRLLPEIDPLLQEPDTSDVFSEFNAWADDRRRDAMAEAERTGDYAVLDAVAAEVSAESTRRLQAMQDQSGEIVAAAAALNERRAADYEDLVMLDRDGRWAALQKRCAEMAGVLEEKAAPEEGDEFRNWLMAVAVGVAEAGKSGGFLGIGGRRVTDDERAALSRVAGILGLRHWYYQE